MLHPTSQFYCFYWLFIWIFRFRKYYSHWKPVSYYQGFFFSLHVPIFQHITFSPTFVYFMYKPTSTPIPPPLFTKKQSKKILKNVNCKNNRFEKPGTIAAKSINMLFYNKILPNIVKNKLIFMRNYRATHALTCENNEPENSRLMPCCECPFCGNLHNVLGWWTGARQRKVVPVGTKRA